MNTIEFHRYVVVSDTEVLDVTDHVETCADNDVNYEHVLCSADRWLSDHFGHVDFWLDDYLSSTNNKQDFINSLKREVSDETLQRLYKL